MRFRALPCVFVFCFFSLQVKGQEIGLTLSSLRKEFQENVPQTMAKVNEMGFRNIEMNGTYGLSFPEFIKAIAVNGLTVISFETDFETLQKFPQSVADEARSYGAKYIVCKHVPFSGKSLSKADADHAVDVLNRSGKVMAKNGLLLCYQPQGYEFTPQGDGTMFDYMVGIFDVRYVHFEMNVFWIRQAGIDPAELLKKYPTRFVLLQLKDRKSGSPLSADGKAPSGSSVALGKGDANIAEVMRIARDLGIQYIFLDDDSETALKQIPKSLAYIQTLNHQTRK